MSATFILRTTTNSQYYFNLTADNNEIILTSEQYKAKPSALNGIESVRTNAPNDDRYSRRTSVDGKPYFVLLAANGEPIGTSEQYTSKGAMETGVAAVKSNAPHAPVKDLT